MDRVNLKKTKSQRLYRHLAHENLGDVPLEESLAPRDRRSWCNNMLNHTKERRSEGGRGSLKAILIVPYPDSDKKKSPPFRDNGGCTLREE